MYVCMYVCIIYLSICLSIYLAIYLAIYLSKGKLPFVKCHGGFQALNTLSTDQQLLYLNTDPQ